MGPLFFRGQSQSMDAKPSSLLRWLFDPERSASASLIPRWLFLRALGLIYFSAFFSLLFQIRGIIGPDGILPAGEYQQAVARTAGHARYWYAPTLLWFSTSSHMLLALCWAGLIASVLLTLNIWPRGMLAICWVCFLSFVSAAAEFSGYQSDGMLLEAGFISLFLAPPGWRPGLGSKKEGNRSCLQQHSVGLIAGKFRRCTDKRKEADPTDRENAARPNVQR